MMNAVAITLLETISTVRSKHVICGDDFQSSTIFIGILSKIESNLPPSLPSECSPTDVVQRVLPSPEDQHTLLDNFAILVSRVLSEEMPF